MVLSASKDGVLYVWKVEQSSEEYLKYVADDDLQVAVTKAKWISEKEILIATTDGKLYHYVLKLDDQQALYLDTPTVLYEAEGSAAIWDIAVRRTQG